MKPSDNPVVLRRHFPDRDAAVVIDDGPHRRSKNSSSMRDGAGIRGEGDSDVQTNPTTSADHRWLVMRDFAVLCGTERQARSAGSPSRLWRQNYYLSALEASGALSQGRRAIAWHLVDVARQLGERRPPHPSTVQRWRRQIVLSRKEAYDRWSYFDQMHEAHKTRRRPEEKT
jgi:hypothetical protein